MSKVNEPVVLAEVIWREQKAKVVKFTPNNLAEKRLYWLALSNNTTIPISSRDAMSLTWGGVKKCH